MPATAPAGVGAHVRRARPIAEVGAIEQINPAQAAAIAALFKEFERCDYFQVLELPQTAGPGEIKRNFYRDSRVYHPDRFFHLEEGPAKANLGHISKRLTEAYFVLRDDTRRAKYLADIRGPEREKRLRYTEATESELKAEAKQKAEEVFGTNPKARGFYQTALKDFGAGNWAGAERNLKSAMTFEPGNQKFKEKLAEVQAKLEEQRKASADGFKIK